MAPIPPRPGHDAPAFPLDPLRAFGGGPGNAALNGWKVRVPAAGLQRVRVWDWSHPAHLDVPIVARCNVQTWIQAGDDFGTLGPYPFQALRGVLQYAAGQQKVREEIGIPATGLVFRGSFREVTLDVFRDSDALGLGEGVTDLVASLTQDDYQPNRWRQTALFSGVEEESYSPIVQWLPLGVTRYRASVQPWGSVCDVLFGDLNLNTVDTVPALAVDSWQALPTNCAVWSQDAVSINAGVLPPAIPNLVTLEFE